MTRSLPVAAALLALAASLPAGAAPVIGQPAPAFTATDSQGGARSLDEFKGKTVILEWTNADCPFVRAHYGTGHMQKLQKAMADKGVVWLSVISSAPGRQGHVDGAAADGLTRSRGAAPAAVLLDPAGKVGQLYEAKTTPHMYVIDGGGKLVYAGAIDDAPRADAAGQAAARNHVTAAIEDLAAGRPVATTSTTPYGCAVHY